MVLSIYLFHLKIHFPARKADEKKILFRHWAKKIQGKIQTNLFRIILDSFENGIVFQHSTFVIWQWSGNDMTSDWHITCLFTNVYIFMGRYYYQSQKSVLKALEQNLINFEIYESNMRNDLAMMNWWSDNNMSYGVKVSWQVIFERSKGKLFLLWLWSNI